MDRAPFQIVDVHELLDATLVMLGRQARQDIEVVKDYDRALPPIAGVRRPSSTRSGRTSIDNAVGAMDGRGTLTIRTAPDGDVASWSRSATPARASRRTIRRRIFEPFFTTKPVGEGTGLGLDISWRIVVSRHHGDIRVESAAGETVFRVRLPLAGPDADD